MTQEISSLMDGELESQDSDRAIGACCASEEGARKWNEYHLIGEALRGHAPRRSRVAERVNAALGTEPTVLAPRRARPMSVGRIALAAAASVVTVGVVGWIGMQQGMTPGTVPTVARAPAPAVTAVSLTAKPASRQQTTSPEVHDYLATHRQIPSAEFYRPVAAKGP